MARYQDAIYWIARNDDTEWVKEDKIHMSVTACLIADIFNKTDAQVLLDIRRELKRLGYGE